MKIPLTDLVKKLNGPINLFICCASFEERSQSIARNLDPEIVEHSLIFQNEDYATEAKSNLEKIKTIFQNNHTVSSLRTDDPILVANKFRSSLERINLKSDSTVLLDITTFTHEQLLILLRLIRTQGFPGRFFAVYAGAKDYAIGLKDDAIWLSKGVDEVRSILGYPGNPAPSKKLHLIVLMGFESERAKELIRAYEPSAVSLGVGDKSTAIEADHHATNVACHKKVIDFVNAWAQISAGTEQFAFSTDDPEQAKKSILHQVDKMKGWNTVIAPMNTKISTVGAALAAFEDEAIQLCYAHPTKYNTQGYSSPGNDCRFFDLHSYFRMIGK